MVSRRDRRARCGGSATRGSPAGGQADTSRWRAEGRSRLLCMAPVGRVLFSNRPGGFPTGPGSRSQRAATARREGGTLRHRDIPPFGVGQSVSRDLGPRPFTQIRSGVSSGVGACGATSGSRQQMPSKTTLVDRCPPGYLCAEPHGGGRNTSGSRGVSPAGATLAVEHRVATPPHGCHRQHRREPAGKRSRDLSVSEPHDDTEVAHRSTLAEPASNSSRRGRDASFASRGAGRRSVPCPDPADAVVVAHGSAPGRGHRPGSSAQPFRPILPVSADPKGRTARCPAVLRGP